MPRSPAPHQSDATDPEADISIRGKRRGDRGRTRVSMVRMYLGRHIHRNCDSAVLTTTR
jgi:hypothetical protein